MARKNPPFVQGTARARKRKSGWLVDVGGYEYAFVVHKRLAKRLGDLAGLRVKIKLPERGNVALSIQLVSEVEVEEPGVVSPDTVGPGVTVTP